jgi:ATP-dependent DNA helicase RecG
MKEKIVSENDKLNLAKRQESHFFDRKAKEIDGKKIQKISVAFANSDGGDFIIGVKDDKDEPNPLKRWSGSDNKEYFNKVFQNILEIKPTIPYTAIFLYDPISCTYTLVITIEKSEKVHSTADNSVYVRVSAQSMLIKEPRLIQELSFAKGESTFEDLVYKDALAEDIFESFEIQRFLKDYSPQSDPIDFTVNQNLVDRSSYEPKIAGLLLFNDNPVTLLPRKCGIKITRYDTNEQIPEREHLKEQINVEGSLYEHLKDLKTLSTHQKLYGKYL